MKSALNFIFLILLLLFALTVRINSVFSPNKELLQEETEETTTTLGLFREELPSTEEEKGEDESQVVYISTVASLEDRVENILPSTSTLRPRNRNSLISDHKKKRLLKFLRHFRLDISKFDATCLKRRGVTAPLVTNARITKYARRRNRAHPKNRYAMVLYKCDEGYEFPPESADRMFCSVNKWVGPTPVCLPKGSLEESECSKCEQVCSNEQPQATCSCYSGYEMVNGTCVDINECADDNGECEGVCFNKPGTFQCFCNSGYQVGPDGKKCLDRNECLLRNGHGPCQDTCKNIPGSYICSCEGIPGTRLTSDKHSCEDINECEEQLNFGCSHLCINTFGNAFCTCPSGLVLSPLDYKTCISEQSNNIESEGRDEVLPPPPYPPPANLEIQLECPPGSSPDTENSRICVEYEDCTIENGGCNHICVPSGSFRFCSCYAGYELMNETACFDVNECEQRNGDCDQICLNIPGSFICSCKEGYKLSDDNKSCRANSCSEPPTLPNSLGWECESKQDIYQVEKDEDEIYYYSGTACKIRCQPGFTVDNLFSYAYFEETYNGGRADRIVCNNEGQWSPPDFHLKSPCILPSCPKLPAPRDGSLFPDTCLQDNVPFNTQCLILCSPGYYPKNGRIRTCSKGFRWFPEYNPLCIRLPPTPRPYIHCPSDISVDLKPGQPNAYVKIPQPQANMDWYRYVEADPPWAKNLEWDVPAGFTQIVFTARSPVSNDTSTCHFKIHVVDREAPRVQGCPTSFEIRLSPGETSREVWWSEPKFSDNVNVKYVQQSHSPGHLLSKGTHHVTFIAGDAEGNKARCSFTITVHGSEDYEMADYSSYYYPRNSRHMIICPNLKTGRWTIHYAYYLPPGCLYHSQGLFSKHFKQNTYRMLRTRRARNHK